MEGVSSADFSLIQKICDIGRMMVGKSRVYTDHQKYIILRNHFLPGEKYEFKNTLKHGCYRSCKKEHLLNCSVFSLKKDGVFCIFCALFLNADKRRSRGSFVNQGYREWHKGKESRHSGNNYHQQAVEEVYGIIERFKNPMNTVTAKLNDELKQRHHVYPKTVETLARAIQLLGRQGLALCGHRESLENETNENQGNYFTLVREIADYYPLLKNHLGDPLRKDVKYLGPKKSKRTH